MVTLLIMSVVELTEINAVYGRTAGDEVLRHVAQAIGAEVHVPDVVVRYDGSNFVALLGSGIRTLQTYWLRGFVNHCLLSIDAAFWNDGFHWAISSIGKRSTRWTISQ